MYWDCLCTTMHYVQCPCNKTQPARKAGNHPAFMQASQGSSYPWCARGLRAQGEVPPCAGVRRGGEPSALRLVQLCAGVGMPSLLPMLVGTGVDKPSLHHAGVRRSRTAVPPPLCQCAEERCACPFCPVLVSTRVGKLSLCPHPDACPFLYPVLVVRIGVGNPPSALRWCPQGSEIRHRAQGGGSHPSTLLLAPPNGDV